MESIEESYPSFYEIAMQDRLGTMLYNSVKLMLNSIFDKLPYAFFIRYLDEFSSIICSALDTYFLYKTKGTFTENFYSLCRTNCSWKTRAGYAFIHYFLPLIVKNSYAQQGYDIIKGVCMGFFLYFNYPYFSPEFRVLKQRLIRQKTKYSMSYFFIGLLLLLKFLEIYFNSKKKSEKIVSDTNIKPPYDSTAVPRSICGICREKWTNPTALTTSGYIFCYTCIRSHVQLFGMCPITKIKSSLNSLRKIHI